MSHFTVVVISKLGENWEDQLAPYNENLQCEPRRVYDVEEDPVVKARERLIEQWDRYDEWTAAGQPDVDSKASIGGAEYWQHRGNLEVHEGKVPARDADDETVMAWYYENDRPLQDEDGKWYRISTYNPDSQWDWYAVGGRWRGFWRLKENFPMRNLFTPVVGDASAVFDNAPTHDIDQALKGQIDFEYGRAAKRAEADKEFSSFLIRTDGIEPPPMSWEKVREEMYAGDIDAARVYWNNHPWVKALGADLRPFGEEALTYWCVGEPEQRKAFIEKEAATAGVPFAFIKDGQWVERGDMGWWGVVLDEMDRKDWESQFWGMLDAVPDDALLTLVDCHI